MKVKVPNNLNVTELLEGLNLSNTVLKNMKDKIYRFVSKMVITNYTENSFNDGYIRICNSEIKTMFGHHRKKILDLLISKDVIEIKKTYILNERCNSYRLNELYQKSKYTYKTIKDRSKTKKKPIYLLDRYFNKKLKISKDTRTVIENIINEVYPQLTTDNQRKVFKNRIGNWLTTIKNIEQHQYWYSKSTTNYRYNSNITNIPKVIRGCLKYNNEQLVQVDIKSSQLYVLASIMNYDFFKSDNKISFDNITININNEENKTYTKSYMFSPLMWAQFSKLNKKNFDMFMNNLTALLKARPKDHDEIKKFRNAPFSEDFYAHLFHLENNAAPTPEQRKAIKSDIMYVLFESNRGHRKQVEGVRLLKNHYPYINKSIELMIDNLGKRDFSLILQRVESYLVLDCVVSEFHNSFPDAPIFTIHDSVITTEPFYKDLARIMKDVLLKQTNIKPGLSIDFLKSETTISEEFVSELISKIQKKSTDKKYKKIQYSILNRNIEVTDEFIKNNNILL